MQMQNLKKDQLPLIRKKYIRRKNVHPDFFSCGSSSSTKEIVDTSPETRAIPKTLSGLSLIPLNSLDDESPDIVSQTLSRISTDFTTSAEELMPTRKFSGSHEVKKPPCLLSPSKLLKESASNIADKNSNMSSTYERAYMKLLNKEIREETEESEHSRTNSFLENKKEEIKDSNDATEEADKEEGQSRDGSGNSTPHLYTDYKDRLHNILLIYFDSKENVLDDLSSSTSSENETNSH